MEVPAYLLPRQTTTSEHNQATYLAVQLMVTALAALFVFFAILFI